jgi:molybdate transport system ATP-binding protein
VNDRGLLDVSVRVTDRVEAAFTAGPGEVMAVIGPNGAGKS